MNKKELLQKMASLESVNDQLQAEIRFIDELLRKLGFDDGMNTLKKAADELLKTEEELD